MNGFFTRLAPALLAACLAACNTVTAPSPMGEEVFPLVVENWEGRWHAAEGYMDVEVTHPARGLLRITIPEGDEQDVLDVQLRQSGTWLFASVTERDFNDSQGLGGPDGEKESETYLWARIRMDGNVIIAWRPSPEVFSRLVNEGLLPGTVADGDVALDALAPGDYARLASGELGFVFDCDNPIALFRAEGFSSPE